MKQRRWILWLALLVLAGVGFASFSLSTSKSLQPTLAPSVPWSQT